MTDIQQIKKLREELGASIADIRNALEEADGNEDKARELLKKHGLERAEKKAEREIKVDRVFTYAHSTSGTVGGTVGGTVVLGCETDFVARTDDFNQLGKELAMQAASAAGTVSTNEFIQQDYIRDPGKTVGTLVQEVSGKLGENLQIKYMRHDPEE